MLGLPKSISLQRGIRLYPQERKVVFAPHKTSFVKNNGRFCTSCKQVGHIEQKYMKKKSQANVSLIKLDSFYDLLRVQMV